MNTKLYVDGQLYEGVPLEAKKEIDITDESIPMTKKIKYMIAHKNLRCDDDIVAFLKADQEFTTVMQMNSGKPLYDMLESKVNERNLLKLQVRLQNIASLAGIKNEAFYSHEDVMGLVDNRYYMHAIDGISDKKAANILPHFI